MYPIFKKGDIVFTEVSRDIVRVTNDSGERSPLFTGEVIGHIPEFPKPKGYYPKGYFSSSWWKPVFHRHFIKPNNIKIIC